MFPSIFTGLLEQGERRRELQQNEDAIVGHRNRFLPLALQEHQRRA